MFWVKEYQKMVHFITTNLFNWSGVWIWNRFRVIFKWKQWRVNLNITIINGMMIKYPHYSWNHRDGFGRRRHGFEVSCWRFAVPLSWWISWFIAIKGVEMVHISSKNWRKEFMATDDAGIILMLNYSTEFTNNLLLKSESCNNWLESCCINVGVNWRTKMMRAMN